MQEARHYDRSNSVREHEYNEEFGSKPAFHHAQTMEAESRGGLKVDRVKPT